MDEQTSTPFNSYTALNRAMLLKSDRDDPLLASIQQEAIVEYEDSRRATVWYIDPETEQRYGVTLMTPNIKEQLTEEYLRGLAGKNIWRRVMMGRVSNNGKIR